MILSDHNLIAISAAIIAGVSTGAGALPIYLKRNFSKNFLNVGLGFSAGVMLVASFVSLIFPSFETGVELFSKHLAFLSSIFGIIIGYLGIIALHKYLPHDHFLNLQKSSRGKRKYGGKLNLIALAIALHNIPEGLAVGVGFGGEQTAEGIALAIAIAIQNVPEGLVVALSLLREGASKHKAFLMALASGLVEPVAAIIGLAAVTVSQITLPFFLALAGGMMLFVICQEILPELFTEGQEKHATLGVLFGVLTMLCIDFYL